MKKKLLTLAVLLFVMANMNASIYYVSTRGNDSNDGKSWSTAKLSIENTVSFLTAGDELWVAGGDYVVQSTIFYVEGAKIYGGFAGTETRVEDRARGAKLWDFTTPTRLNIPESTTVRIWDRADKSNVWTKETVIDGFCMENINGGGNKCIYGKEALVVKNCIFRKCTYGGGTVYFEDGGTLVNCLVESSYVYYRGVAPDREGMSAENCVFRNNANVFFYTTGGGHLLTDEAGHFTNCVFEDYVNVTPFTVQHGWGERPIILKECRFQNNTLSSSNGSILGNKGGTGMINLDKCVFSKNKSMPEQAGEDAPSNGIITLANVIMTNCLVTNNSSAATVVSASTSSFLINNTITNNIGDIHLSNGSYAMSNIANQKVIFSGEPPVEVFINNAVREDFEYTGSNGGVALVDNIKIADFGFVKATSFSGIPESDAQKAEMATAEWSLSAVSPCVNEGDVIVAKEMLGELWDIYLAKDLVGNSRGNTNHIGALQGGMGTGLTSQVVDEQLFIVYSTNGELVVSSKTAGIMQVYSATGMLVKEQLVMEGENTIKGFVKGLYIVTMKNTKRSVKVIIK